jgi:carboxyl-terminal processing protease
MLEHDVAYVRIAGFSANTPNDLRNSIEQLRSSHANKLAGVIVDLRNNPGGVLESAVEIADELLDRGIIVIAQGRTAEARFRMQAERGQLLAGVPLAVLINGASASAAEILAAALRDNGRATLVGRRTFGKGTVQTVIPLSGGRALKLTTSRYLTPRGVSIQDLGIAPDVAVEGIDEPPVGIGAPDSLPLAHRDRDVRIALDHLRAQRHRLAQVG